MKKNIYNEIFLQKTKFKNKLNRINFSNYLHFFSIKVLIRFYCNYGSLKKDFNDIWKNFVIGHYLNYKCY